MVLKFALIRELPPAVYITEERLLLTGQVYFSSGRLFSNTFIKFLDSCADYTHFLLPYYWTARSQKEPTATKHDSISATCFGSIFYDRFYTRPARAFKPTVSRSKSSCWQWWRIDRVRGSRVSVNWQRNSSSGSKLITIPKE